MSKLTDDLERLLNTCFSCQRSFFDSCQRSFFDETASACAMCMNSPNYPMEAPEGQIFVCGACGKQNRALFSSDDALTGWDESCMANAVLCYQDSWQVVPGYEPTPRKGRKLSP